MQRCHGHYMRAVVLIRVLEMERSDTLSEGDRKTLNTFLEKILDRLVKVSGGTGVRTTA